MHYPVILRCTGASDSWLSPAYGQETCFFGFVVYYAEDGSLAPEGVDFLRAVERVLAEVGGRPHWGKYFDESLYDWSRALPAVGSLPRRAGGARPAAPLRQRVHRRAVRPTDAAERDLRGDRRMKAWATLLTQPATWWASARCAPRWNASAARYPLVVAVTAGIDAEDRALLEADGLPGARGRAAPAADAGCRTATPTPASPRCGPSSGSGG